VSHRTHAIAYMTIAKGSIGDECIFDIDYAASRLGATGYAWAFPLGNEANVGIGWGWAKWRNAKRELTEFTESLGLKPGQILGHPISLGRVRKPLHRGNILLIGEAAGLADAMTGEGIYHAVVSGASAALAAWAATRVRGDARWAGHIYEELVAWLVEEVERSRRFSRIVDILRRVVTRGVARAMAQRAAKMYLALYRGEATYGALPLSIKRIKQPSNIPGT